jgi:hypothetical protein
MITLMELTLYPPVCSVKDNLEKFMTLVREFPARPTRLAGQRPPESIPMSGITKHPRQPTTTRAASTAACHRLYLEGMVWPDKPGLAGSSCVELAGASPVAVSAEAPRSRLQPGREIARAELSVESLRRGVCLGRGERNKAVMRPATPM